MCAFVSVCQPTTHTRACLHTARVRVLTLATTNADTNTHLRRLLCVRPLFQVTALSCQARLLLSVKPNNNAMCA